MPTSTLNRLKGLPIRRTKEVWEVAAAPLPVMVPSESGGRPEQVVACVCVSSEGGVAMAGTQTVRSFDPSSGLVALSRFALDPLVPGAKPLNYLPAKVHVCPMPEQATRTLVAALLDLGIAIEVKDEIALAAGFFQMLSAQMEGSDPDIQTPLLSAPPLAGVKGMSLERIAAFADAASMFWKAAPWKCFDREVVWRIKPSPTNTALAYCTIMGGAGEEFGLAFLTDPMQMMAMGVAEHPSDYWDSAKGTHWAITFDPQEDAPTADVRYWKEHALPLAAPGAFPIPMGVTTKSDILRPAPADLTFMEGLLRVLATIKKADIKSGTCTREVDTFEGSCTVTLDAAIQM